MLGLRHVLLFSILTAVLVPAHAEGKADWTVFALPPCALADVAVTGRRDVRINARGAGRDLREQGGDAKGCGVPTVAHAVLVDLLVDARKAGRLSGTGGEAIAIQRGLTTRRAILNVCRAKRCDSDIALRGLADGDRVRVFVRGYLMRGERYASTDDLTALLDRDRQRVKDCQVIVGPNGELVRIGADCGLDYNGVPAGDVPADGGDAPAGDPGPTGCPFDYFDEDEWFETETRFRFPVEPAIHIAPTVIHMDHNREEADNEYACEPYFPGMLCYDNHEGTDYSLIGLFWAQDSESVFAVAAADGVVMSTREDRFDRCVADLEPLDCSAQQCYQLFDQTLCTPCRDNPDFGQPYCQEGDEPRDYDNLVANFVKLCHADGTITRYLHLMTDSVMVEEGERVDCGDQLGLIGSSGRSSAPHLHFDVTRQGLGEWLDPYDVGSGESLWVSPSLPGFLPGSGCQ